MDRTFSQIAAREQKRQAGLARSELQMSMFWSIPDELLVYLSSLLRWPSGLRACSWWREFVYCWW